MDKESKVFAYLSQAFVKLSETKMKEGVFVSPQINPWPANVENMVSS